MESASFLALLHSFLTILSSDRTRSSTDIDLAWGFPSVVILSNIRAIRRRMEFDASFEFWLHVL